MPKENCTNFDVVLHILYKKILFIYGLCFAKPKNMCKLIKINLPGRRKKCIEVQWKNIGKRKMVGYGIYNRYSCYIYSIDWWWCWAIRNLEKECERRSLLRSIENGFCGPHKTIKWSHEVVLLLPLPNSLEKRVSNERLIKSSWWLFRSLYLSPSTSLMRSLKFCGSRSK